MPLPVKERTEQKHVGYGKVILFGEHFVVHGAEAIVAGICEYTECRLEVMRGMAGVQVVDERPAVPGYIEAKRGEQAEAHQLVLKHLGIDTRTDGLRIFLGGPLVPSSGIGASASDVVSLSRALSELYDLKLNDDAINESAFAGECGYHGTPSGVDNTAATFGGLISYRRVSGKSLFSPIPFSAELYLVVVGTGITASTVEVVRDVQRLKEQDPAFFDQLFSAYEAIAKKAQEAFLVGDLKEVGALMTATHDLCRKLTISCDELEQIVSCCMAHGALGAKLSGTGRGGIAVALASDATQQNTIAAALGSECSAAKFIWKYTVMPNSQETVQV
ncbi:unnamed protein product [Phytomonas sp. EM1]|nr:unnamed protein product [Phytomonas sp. EM1]|eukprot:CCW65205.1 unnamed protein product [Phytomonas sp. isolate EM1]